MALDALSLSLVELTAQLKAIGEPAYRAAQIFDWIYKKHKFSWEEMSSLPKPLREKLSAQIPFPVLIQKEARIAADGTRKFLFELFDGQLIEAVFIPTKKRATLCISSQAGCGMACPFCATGQGGLTRNLSTAEILEQVRAAAVTLRDMPGNGPGGDRLSNVVFMGMGEPLANYASVLGAVERITAAPPDGFGISARAVTVSTVGLAPAIRKLADVNLSVTLAVSLHTPDDELRATLVPVNNRWKISEVLDAARYYADVTGRRVSIEYALIRDINDQAWRADLLGQILHRALGPLVHVNLIPLNPTPGSKWDASPKPVEREFVRRVLAQGVSCTVRDTRGREIAAACGQLAAEG